MGSTARRSYWQRSAAQDLWRHTLDQIHSVFGRLIYLASLRDAATGRYEHHGLALTFTPQEAEQTIRKCHEEVFAEWLTKPTADQHNDIAAHLEASAKDRRQIVDHWVRTGAFRNWVPASAKPRERDLFATDMEALVETIRVEFGVDAPDPDA